MPLVAGAALNGQDIAILLAVGAGGAVVAYLVFTRRDL